MLRWLFALSICLFITPVAAQQPPTQPNPRIDAQVQSRVQTTGNARVIVSLKTPGRGNAAIAQAQSSVLNATGPGLSVGYQYQTIPAFSAAVNSAALAQLANNPSVLRVEIDLPGSGDGAEALPALGGDTVHASGITGEGILVGVLDSGIDTDHPDLADDLVGQKCFNIVTDCPSNGNDVQVGDSAEDENGHGTHVTGIITSAGNVAPIGFAPDANIVAVRVLDRDNLGVVSDWIAGLDWLNANYSTYPVDIINMSLVTDARYTSTCDSSQSAFYTAAQNLVDRGVLIFASSGNNRDATALAAPSCLSNVVAVGASYDSDISYINHSSYFGCVDTDVTLDDITCFTNSNDQLELVAPGSPITSTWLSGSARILHGTSMASPAAAGVAALIKESQPNLTAAQILERMKTTGVTVTDPRNSVQIPRIDAFAAVNANLYDLNEDGNVDEEDINYAIARLGTQSTDSPASATSDVNQDGQVTPTDALLIVNFLRP